MNLPAINITFMFERFHPIGGSFDKARPAMFWGECPRSGIRGMTFMDKEGGVELVNTFHGHRYTAMVRH